MRCWDQFKSKEFAAEEKARADNLQTQSLLVQQIRAPGFFSAQAIGSEDSAEVTRGKHLAFSLAASVDWAAKKKDREVWRVAIREETASLPHPRLSLG